MPSNKSRSSLIVIANHLLTTTGKGIEKTFKWMATDHSRSPEYLSVTEALQSLNYLRAHQKLLTRRLDRNMKHLYSIPTRKEVVRDWLIDHLLFTSDILWGFLQTLLENFFYGLLRLIAIILANFIFFYVLIMLILH
jgi:hypothetical protein